MEEASMPYMVARDRFEDYAQWRRVWDAGAAAREAAGLKSAQLFRSADAPNEILILCEVESLPQEVEYLQSQPSRERREHAGVVGETLYFPIP
jgi:hypothetical protein